MKTALAKEAPGENVKEILDQVHEVAAILKCYKGSTSRTYTEGGKLISHNITVIKDLDK